MLLGTADYLGGAETSSSFTPTIVSVPSATGASPLAVRAATSPCFCVLVRAAVWASLVWCRPPWSPVPAPRPAGSPRPGRRSASPPGRARCWARTGSAHGRAGLWRYRGSRCLVKGGWKGCGTWEGKGRRSAWRSWRNSGGKPDLGPRTRAACCAGCCRSRGSPLERERRQEGSL